MKPVDPRGDSAFIHPRPAAIKGGPAARPRRTWALAVLALAALAAFSGFVALGTWQVQRRAWKHDLIARVEARIHAAPVDAPGPALWAALDAGAEEYRRVQATGVLLNDRETLVKAVTSQGDGFWVVTPLRTDRGFTVLVNRGFVPADRREPAARAAGQPAGTVTVTGLLRPTEPKGAFLRGNDPAAGRWFSRDVAAIAAARSLGDVAPYFIDADGTPNPGGWPVGGLTVIAFPDNHLVYAVTWYMLAVMVVGASIFVARDERRTRSGLAEASAGRAGDRTAPDR